MKPLSFKLCVILDIDTCQRYAEISKIVRKVVAGGADILQLRCKGYPDREIIKIGQNIRRITAKRKVLFVLNDRADLARVIDADGLHLGQQDLPIKQARRILANTDKLIGISTHNLSQALAAKAQGANYISIGPIFSSSTKPNIAPLAGSLISQIKAKLNAPLVAIGGITLENIDQVLQLGLRRIAVCKAIISAKDITKTTKQFKQTLSKV